MKRNRSNYVETVFETVWSPMNLIQKAIGDETAFGIAPLSMTPFLKTSETFGRQLNRFQKHSVAVEAVYDTVRLPKPILKRLPLKHILNRPGVN